MYDEGLRRIGRIDEDCVRKIFGTEGPKPGCFLTSACVEAKGLSDNCYELNTLRSFRDNYLRNMPGGLAEIETYYRVSPVIVAEIHKKDDAFAILSSLYDNLVQPCVKMIENGDYSGAYGHYKATVSGLCSEFLNS